MSTSSPARPLVVGVTGASGAPIALKVLQVLAETDIPVALVVSDGGAAVLREECGLYPRDLEQYADATYDDGDSAAKIASGSSSTRGMVIVPCSGNTLAKISHGFADTLITRAAQVHLKERRPLVLVPRETPLSPITLRNMTTAAEAGAMMLMASPPYYLKAERVEELVAYLAGKVLDQFSVPHKLYRGWKADEAVA
ncbi:MAG: UbiX family flavin prenyltransferase [Euryarchaeota archaeon]|nr:UbiX family flavin prenyltransferase [Euryarchaeota archaeon]MDE1837803.1 UbiX family flavin prenyltransferase [Euryarchaeota archaeon]MDE1880360.1 UbiX family flavin prenyltransferase [Euryarchaeota archaeon]MDE2046187.1 UbiX family flavin prenyltransferase [Thermoplasmata archaeon]